jgi:hypothetical protein
MFLAGKYIFKVETGVTSWLLQEITGREIIFIGFLSYSL